MLASTPMPKPHIPTQHTDPAHTCTSLLHTQTCLHTSIHTTHTHTHLHTFPTTIAPVSTPISTYIYVLPINIYTHQYPHPYTSTQIYTHSYIHQYPTPKHPQAPTYSYTYTILYLDTPVLQPWYIHILLCTHWHTCLHLLAYLHAHTDRYISRYF